MVEQGAYLRVDAVVEQVFELAGLGVPLLPLEVEDVHQQPLRKPVPAYGHHRFVAPFLAQVDPLAAHLDVGQAVEFLQPLVIEVDAQDREVGGVLPLLFGGNPEGLQDLFGFFGQFHRLSLPPLSSSRWPSQRLSSPGTTGLAYPQYGQCTLRQPPGQLPQLSFCPGVSAISRPQNPHFMTAAR